MDSILQALRDGFRKRSGTAAITLDGKKAFYIDFQRQHVWFAGTQTVDDRMLGSRLMSLRGDVRMVESAIPESLRNGQMRKPQSLTSMVWDASLLAQTNGVDTAVTERSVVRLLRWPGFHLLAHRHDHFRLCSLLLRKACCASECAQMLDLSESDVLDFMRAAYYTGCADIEGVREVVPDDMPAHRGAGSRLAGWWRSVRQGQRVEERA